MKRGTAVCSQQFRICSMRKQQLDTNSMAAYTGIMEGRVSSGVRVHLSPSKQQLLHTSAVSSAGSQTQR